MFGFDPPPFECCAGPHCEGCGECSGGCDCTPEDVADELAYQRAQQDARELRRRFLAFSHARFQPEEIPF